MDLWDTGQKLHEERATAERLRTLAAFARNPRASYASEQWQVLLGYLGGKGALGLRQ